ncbi:MAG: acyl-CoA dehydrogenase family protein [Nitrospinota bacterium]
MLIRLSTEQKLLKETAAGLAREHLAPAAAELDKGLGFPWVGLKKLAEAGLMGMTVPLGHGGAGSDALPFVLVIEEIAKACASTALSVITHSTACRGIARGGTEEAKGRFLPALAKGEMLGAFAVHEEASGVIAPAIETVARAHARDYVVNGSKIFATNAKEAEVYLILVRIKARDQTDEISLLLLERETRGLSFGEVEERMGFNGVSCRELSFKDCRVPEGNLVGGEGGGLQLTVGIVGEVAMFGAGAIALGLSQAALDASIEHARGRAIAGSPIGAHQGVQFLVAEMALAVDAIRALLYSTAALAQEEPRSLPLSSFKMKQFACEAALAVTDKALQVHGGHGYCRALPIERYYRDARGLTLHFMTPEVLKAAIGKLLLE